MICPKCGSYKVSDNTSSDPKIHEYWCLECHDGFNEGDYFTMNDYIDVYTDGACSCNPGPSGVGVLLRYKKHERRISRFIGEATNNIAELTAIKTAFESVSDKTKSLRVTTDSQYSIGVLSNPTWNPKKNKELIEQIKILAAQFNKVDYVWVKGHSGNTENDIVDNLAVKAYKDKKDFDVRSTQP